jgi:hypothetical protein
MKENKNEERLARKRRLANALKANLTRRKAQRRKKEADRSQINAAPKEEA